MKLSFDMHKALVNDLDVAVQGMRGSDSPADKLYFFSAVYGVAQRIANLEYQDELIFIHQVALLTYQQMIARLNSMRQAQESPVRFHPALFEQLESCIDDLQQCIDAEEPVDSVLKRMAILGYSTTGNGFFLCVKGRLMV